MAGPLEGQPALIHASRGSSGRQRQGQQELPTGGGVMATLPPGHQSLLEGTLGRHVSGPAAVRCAAPLLCVYLGSSSFRVLVVSLPEGIL